MVVNSTLVIDLNMRVFGASKSASSQTVRCMVRNVAEVLKRQFPSALMQLAAARISSVVAASTGIDASAVSTAADDPAIGVTSASVNHTAETTKSMLAKRFTILRCGECSRRVIRRR
jgi:hypothetical protein